MKTRKKVKHKMMQQKEYLVVAIYSDDNSRFADTYNALSPQQAEKFAVEDHPGLIVAGVLDMAGRVVA